MIQIFRFLFSGKVTIWLLCLMALILPLTIPGQFGIPLFKSFMLGNGILSLPFLVLFGLLILNQIGATFIRLSWYFGGTSISEPEEKLSTSTMETELEENSQQVPSYDHPPQRPAELAQHKGTIQTILPVNNARAIIETLGFQVTGTAQFLDNKEEIESKKGTSRTLSTFLLHVGVTVLLAGLVLAFMVYPTRQVKLLQEQPSVLGGLERTPWQETLKKIGLVTQDNTDYPRLPVVLTQVQTLQTKVRILQQPQKHLTRWENSLSQLFFKPTKLDIQAWSIPAVYHATSYLKLGRSQKLVELSQKANISHGPYILSFGGTYAEASVMIAGQIVQLKQSELHPLPLGGTLELLGYLPQHENMQTGCLLLRYAKPKQTPWSACVPHGIQAKIANNIDFQSKKIVQGIVLNYSNRLATNLIVIGLILFLMGFIGFWWFKRYRIFMVWRRDKNEINIEASGYGVKAKSMLKGIKESLFFPIENITGPSRPQGGPSTKGGDGSRGLGQNVSSLARNTVSSSLLPSAGSPTAMPQNKVTHPGKTDSMTASSMVDNVGNVAQVEAKSAIIGKETTNQTASAGNKPTVPPSTIAVPPSTIAVPAQPSHKLSQPQVPGTDLPSKTLGQTTSAQKLPAQSSETSPSKPGISPAIVAKTPDPTQQKQGQLVGQSNNMGLSSTTGTPIVPVNSTGTSPSLAIPQKNIHTPTIESVTTTPLQTTSATTSSNPFVPAPATPPMPAQIKESKVSTLLPAKGEPTTTTETGLPAAQTPPKQSVDLVNEDSAQMTIQTQSRWRQTDSFDKDTILQAAKQRPKGLAALDTSANSTNQTNSQPTINRVKPESLLEPSEPKQKPIISQTPQTALPTAPKNTPNTAPVQSINPTLTNINPPLLSKSSTSPSGQLPPTQPVSTPPQTLPSNPIAPTPTSASLPVAPPTARPPQSTLAPQIAPNGDKKEAQPAQSSAIPPTAPKQNTVAVPSQPSVSTLKPVVTSSLAPVTIPAPVIAVASPPGGKAPIKTGSEAGINLDSLFAGIGGEKTSTKGSNENFFENLDIDSLFEKVENNSAEKTAVSARPVLPIDDAKTSVSTPRPNFPKKS